MAGSTHDDQSAPPHEAGVKVGDLCLAPYGDEETDCKGRVVAIHEGVCEVKWDGYDETSEVATAKVYPCREFTVPSAKAPLFRHRSLLDFAAEKTKTQMRYEPATHTVDVAGRLANVDQAEELLQTIVDTYEIEAYQVISGRVGRLVGPRGKTREDLQKDCGAVLIIPPRQEDNEEVAVEIIGAPEAVAKAKEAIAATTEFQA